MLIGPILAGVEGQPRDDLEPMDVGPASSVPPNSAARWRMPIRPRPSWAGSSMACRPVPPSSGTVISRAGGHSGGPRAPERRVRA